MKIVNCKRICLIAGLIYGGMNIHAQYLRTSYFMEGTSYRLQMNPGLQPTRGYFNFPVIGSLNVAASSNVLGTNDIIDILDSKEDLFTNDKLYNRLKPDNRLNVNFNTDILSFGWYKGKGFWSVNVGLRTDIGASLTKSMFEYMRNIDGFNIEDGGVHSYELGNQRVNINAYAEVGLGYSRPITDRLTIGGRVKALLGVAHAEMEVERFDVDLEMPDMANVDPENLRPEDWYGSQYAYNVKANVTTSFSGGGLGFNENQQIDGFDFDGGIGIAGLGFGVDLGASYKLLDNLTLSAAVLDLGFINWKKSETTVASVEKSAQETIDENNYNQFLSSDFLNLERFNLTQDEEAAASYKTRLSSTVLVAGEYTFFNNKLGVGAMYSARFVEPKTLNELTLSLAYRPKNWFNIAASYSPVQANGKSFGVALKLGPLFVGTDYMYLGGNSNSVNGFIGISFPLGKKKTESI